MKNLKTLLLFLLLTYTVSYAGQYHKEVKPTKNLIFMIADGTSNGVISAARWYQIYNNLGGDKLALDPYLCGMVKTYSSNSPIPDSAPAMSAFMTGQLQRTGNLSVYPMPDPDNDIIKVDPAKSHQPIATLLEAAKYEKGKATGLVVTQTFDHATPAACASHASKRGERSYIASQMAHLGLDVVFGGGYEIITPAIKEHLKKTGTAYFENDVSGFREFDDGDKIWSLFTPKLMSFDLDRDDSQEPSLAEMTRKAIDILSENENGFFLMVEGSQVDWAAHANDPVGLITDFIAFDRAVAEAIEFAIEDGNTTVVITSDHGNAGMGFGDRNFKGYTNKGLDSTFMSISKCGKTARGLEQILLKTKPADIASEFKKYTGMDITNAEKEQLLSSKNYKESDYMKISSSVNMIATIAKIVTSRTHFAFISGGHTGEDVFLAAYHPEGDIPYGLNTNTELNRYMFDALGLDKSLEELSGELFVRHDRLFKGSEFGVDEKGADGQPVLTVKHGDRTLEIPANGSKAYLNGKSIDLGAVAVYISGDGMFYLPKSCAELIK